MVSRYDVAVGVEGDYEPNSRRKVLRNLPGIKSKAEMDRVEHSSLLLVQEKYYTDGSITTDTRFTSDLIRQMHKDWLGDIYVWAGEYRTVDMSRDGFVFPPAIRVPENMRRFEQQVLKVHTPCLQNTLPEVCCSVAVVHADFLLIHPFQEGNGRLARWLANLMIAQAGMPIPDYGFIGRGSKGRRQEYLSAVIRGYGQDYEPLALFFEQALADRLRG